MFIALYSFYITHIERIFLKNEFIKYEDYIDMMDISVKLYELTRENKDLHLKHTILNRNVIEMVHKCNAYENEIYALKNDIRQLKAYIDEIYYNTKHLIN